MALGRGFCVGFLFFHLHIFTFRHAITLSQTLGIPAVAISSHPLPDLSLLNRGRRDLGGVYLPPPRRWLQTTIFIPRGK